MAQRYQSRLAQAQPVQDNRPQLFQSLADKISAFASREADAVDRQVAKKAKEQGLADAQGKTEITLRDGTTIADEAWNEGAKVSHLAAIKLDVTENISRIAAENPDPEEFYEVAKGYSAGLLEGVDDRFKPVIENELSNVIMRGKVSAQKDLRTAQLKEQQAVSSDAFDLISAQTLDAADSNNIEMTEELQGQANTMIDGMVANTALTAAEGVKAKAELSDKIDSQIVIGEFKKALEKDKDEEFLKKFASKKLNKFFDPTKREKLLTEMLTIRKHRDSISSIKKAAATKEIKLFLKAKADGYTASKDETIRISKMADDADLTEEFNKSVEDIDEISFYGKATAVDRREKISTLQASGDLDDYSKWKQLKEADARITKAAQKDGYALASKQGIIEPTPLDYKEPATFKAREQQAQLLSQHYGVEVSPFTDEEVKQLVASVEGMTPQEQALTAMSIGEMDSPKVFKEIAKNKAPIFAMMAAVGVPEVAETVFTGQIELDSGNVKIADKELALADMYEYLGDVYTGENLAAVREASFAHYAATNGNNDYDDDKLKDSMKAVTGGVAKINGSSIELPRDVSEGEMEDFMDDFSVESVISLGGVDNRTPEEAADMIRNGIWRSRPGGTYAILTPAGELMQNGKPLRIKYDPELKPRRALSFEEFMERK